MHEEMRLSDDIMRSVAKQQKSASDSGYLFMLLQDYQLSLMEHNAIRARMHVMMMKNQGGQSDG